MGKIYQIGDFRLEHRTERPTIRRDGQPLDCEHRNLLLDEHGQTVSCKDCKRDIGAWWALVNLAERYEALINALQGARQQASGPRAPEGQPTRPSPLRSRKSSERE